MMFIAAFFAIALFMTDSQAAKKPAKVAGLLLDPGVGKITMSWTPVKGSNGYEVYYRRAGKGSYKFYRMQTQTVMVAKSKLKTGTAYQFKVRAMKKKSGGGYVKGAFCVPKKCVVLKKAKRVNGLIFDVDNNGDHLKLKWAAFKGAHSYVVSYKEEGTGTWTDLKEVKGTSASLKALDAAKTYKVHVSVDAAGKNTSVNLTVTPGKYLKENKDRILSERVKSISYRGGKAIYTKKHYTNAIKEAYVNYRGFSSKTNYMIWASLYTQQATVFKGKKGKWKLVRTFDIASGRPSGATPRGNFTIFMREKVWASSKVLWVSHFYKKASFHSILLHSNNSVKDGRLGKPISNACIRCAVDNAKFIYKNVPMHSFVRVY